MIPEITVDQLKNWLQDEQNLVLLDVREAWEREINALPNDIHIPLQSLPHTDLTLEPNQKLVIYCHSGYRSARAVEFFQERGLINDIYNLKGGIAAWSFL